MSKDLKPKQKLGQSGAWTTRKKWIVWSTLAVAAGVGFWQFRSVGVTPVEVPVARVRQGDFIISIKTRGEIKAVRSVMITAPQVPDLSIVKLAETGRPIHKGDIVVEFDAAQQEQNYLERNTSVRTVDSEAVQTKASHRITNELDGMSKMTAEYNVERAKLEASKAEVISQIEGAKDRIDVGISEGELGQVNTSIDSHRVAQTADLERLEQRKDKYLRDMARTKGYLGSMVLRAPIDGVVNVMPNFRTQGSFGSAPPPFKEGDKAWTGAQIAEIPDLSAMRIELKLDEVDRGKLQLGMKGTVRVDALPDKELPVDLDWISPIASINWRGAMQEKQFPARATLQQLDPRLRPGMSAGAELVLESYPNSILIPIRASVTSNGKPAVYVQKGDGFVLRQIEVGERNDTDLVVLKGLKAGETVALENPIEAAKKAKKL
ncbi:MAG TPA: HlyD family efflux transporter periplasmic adaptor subunit [Bryobacteraceae bacterium]|jgi:multidrug efflux pump subunit AcrA (membrane-fusion protein)